MEGTPVPANGDTQSASQISTAMPAQKKMLQAQRTIPESQCYLATTREIPPGSPCSGTPPQNRVTSIVDALFNVE
jgi:hypothetical protein